MAITTVDYTFGVGESFRFRVGVALVENGASTPVDLTGFEADYVLRRGGPTGPVALTLTHADGITIPEPGEDASVLVEIAPADTSSLEAGDYHQELEVRGGGDVYRPLRGWVHLLADGVG